MIAFLLKPEIIDPIRYDGMGFFILSFEMDATEGIPRNIVAGEFCQFENSAWY